MIVKSIECSGFMRRTPEKRKIGLPSSGVVLLRGPNGSGKSTWLEAVSYAGWGKVLRDPGGTIMDPWGALPGWVRVTLDVGGSIVVVVRSVSAKGRESITWSITGQPAQTFETPTKAQTALERVIGPWDAWARTHVFSSEDSVALSKAKDGAVKGLLERVFGIERYDLAHKDAADAATAKNRELAAAQRAAAAADSHAAAARARHTAAHEALREMGEAITVTVSDVQAAVQTAAAFGAQAGLAKAADAATLAAAAERVAQWRDEAVGAKAAAERAAAELAAVGDATCGACGRAFDDATEREAHAAELAARHKEADHIRAHAADAHAQEALEHAALAASLAERRMKIDAKIRHLDERVTALRSALTFATQTAQARAAMAKAEAEALEALRAALRAQTDAVEALLEAETDAATQAVTVAVLGPKGMRASVLAAGLEGLTDQANPWLRKFPGKAERIRIEPGRKANGEPNGEIAIVLEGCGGRDATQGSYTAASAGERRRVDLTLLFTLAETAGDGRGTLFLDECFDKLDGDARQPLREILAELARDRCVIVVSHAPEIIAALHPDHVIDLGAV